jgi:hypothetical protein
MHFGPTQRSGLQRTLVDEGPGARRHTAVSHCLEAIVHFAGGVGLRPSVRHNYRIPCPISGVGAGQRTQRGADRQAADQEQPTSL